MGEADDEVSRFKTNRTECDVTSNGRNDIFSESWTNPLIRHISVVLGVVVESAQIFAWPSNLALPQ